ncbi:MmyB family transcriptional regulator [Streptomyces sp. NPDC001781]
MRQLAAAMPGADQRLTDLVSQLTIPSHEFLSRWKRHPVRTCTSGVKQLHHPTAGPLDLAFETLTLPAPSGQRLIAYMPEAGSASVRAPHLLTRTGPVMPRCAQR